MSSCKDTEFGAKLALLEGIVGHQHPAHHFQVKFLAGLLDVTSQQISRKKSGKEVT